LHDVLPVYVAADRACDYEIQRNPALDIELWLQSRTSVLDVHAKNHPEAKAELEALKAAIAKWGNRWYINKPWVRSYALNTLAAWQIGDLVNSGSFARMGIRVAQPLSFSTDETLAGFSYSDRWHFIAEPWSDFKTRFDDHARQFLRAYEHRIRKLAEGHGFVRVPTVPGELTTKLECAALYLCGRKTPEEIVAMGSGYARDKSTIFRWIQDAVELLGLKMKPPGRPPTRNVTRKREL
jgi:hypothetical protein